MTICASALNTSKKFYAKFIWCELFSHSNFVFLRIFAFLSADAKMDNNKPMISDWHSERIANNKYTKIAVRTCILTRRNVYIFFA